MNTNGTLDGSQWDVAIIGAGPAGGVAAAMLSQRGRRVLLIERAAWPREKVCGGCLNAVAVGVLNQAGLGSILRGTPRLEHAVWRVGRQSLKLSAPGGAVILRSELDAAIVAAAIERGCTFAPDVSATLLHAETHRPYRTLRLQNAAGISTVQAGIVLACDGIGGRSLAAEPWAQWHVDRAAWMGAAITCDDWPCEISPGTIFMHVGPGGYVGLAGLSDGRIQLGAALDPAACRSAGGPAALIIKILNSCGIPTSPGLAGGRFRGTAELTRRRKHLGGYRVLAVGDASGYIEPFTGEGMGWAILGASHAVQLLPQPNAQWPADLADQWQARHRATIGRRQGWCRGLRMMVRSPALATIAAVVGRAAPAIGSFVASRVCRELPGAAQVAQGGVA